MAKSQQSWNKKEKEKKRKKKREEKAHRKEERKANAGGSDLDSMLAYVDADGNITTTPPDPTEKREEINVENIEIGVSKRIEEEVDPIRTGTVTFFDSSKGYGFIRDAVSQDSIFTHINGHVDEINERDKVTFQVEPGPKGPIAVDVKLVKA